MKDSIKSKIRPLYMSAAILAADQVTKALVVRASGNVEGKLLYSGLGGFLKIFHQRNLGAAFSFLDGLGHTGRFIGLAVIPFLALVAIMVYYFRTKELSRFQEWALVGAVSGGLGNLIDRFFRPAGVVDFISCYFPGPWGSRWPTFNVADSALVVSCCMILLSFIVPAIGDRKRGKKAAEGGKA